MEEGPIGQGRRRLPHRLPRRVRTVQRRLLEPVPQGRTVAARVSRNFRGKGTAVLRNHERKQRNANGLTLYLIQVILSTCLLLHLVYLSMSHIENHIFF